MEHDAVEAVQVQAPGLRRPRLRRSRVRLPLRSRGRLSRDDGTARHWISSNRHDTTHLGSRGGGCRGSAQCLCWPWDTHRGLRPKLSQCCRPGQRLRAQHLKQPVNVESVAQWTEVWQVLPESLSNGEQARVTPCHDPGHERALQPAVPGSGLCAGVLVRTLQRLSRDLPRHGQMAAGRARGGPVLCLVTARRTGASCAA